MEPQDQNQQPPQAPTPLPEARRPLLLLAAPQMHVLLGALFLTISLVGAAGLASSLLAPRTTDSAPQVAAVVVPTRDYFKDIVLEAESAYVFDVTTNAALYGHNDAAQLPLASITKVMLALAVSEVLPRESTITISREAVARGGGGLTWGEEWRVGDLLDYTLVTSSNTGAEALAEAAEPLLAARYPERTPGNATIWRMNNLAGHIDMQETYFINATGLDESVTQAGAQSSARDIAKLFAYALRTNRDLFARTTEAGIELGPKNFPTRYAHNTNDALSHIEDIIMGKTGTTDLAGGNLAIAFDVAPGHPVVVVVLGSTPQGRFGDVTELVARTRARFADTR